jgi:hypothetical protein
MFCMTELDPRSTQFVPLKYKNPIKAGGGVHSLVMEMDCASGVVAAMRANTYCSLIGSPSRSEAIANIEGRDSWADSQHRWSREGPELNFQNRNADWCVAAMGMVNAERHVL